MHGRRMTIRVIADDLKIPTGLPDPEKDFFRDHRPINKTHDMEYLGAKTVLGHPGDIERIDKFSFGSDWASREVVSIVYLANPNSGPYEYRQVYVFPNGKTYARNLGFNEVHGERSDEIILDKRVDFVKSATFLYECSDENIKDITPQLAKKFYDSLYEYTEILAFCRENGC